METTLRRYGAWPGKPGGRTEKIADCVEAMPDQSTFNGMVTKQCSRKRGHGPDGLYCKQHAKRHDVDRAAYDQKIVR